ncbi:hypothetical protein UFOVP1264_3 [uncultured Caudovirales phage]|uniref:Uncharacterized protein n=1 Tax=uncultured Caudovirales phage TaxID=2100421 RepID=A0A6J5RLB3_9CAUD|nr:hypothetical protein UFOVP1264_3 [uncultured Caudovirales phage]
MARKAATLEDLLKKPARTKELIINVPSASGKSTNEFIVTLKAIGSKAYDDLLANHPPTSDQKKEGSSYNVDTFAPALIASCSVTPELSPEQAVQIWESNEWSRGELTELFLGCIEVNSKGLDVPFNDAV